MLEAHEIDFKYRDYRLEPLDEGEIRRLLALLELGPKDVLRRRDRAFREIGLSGDEADHLLISHMARHPTLLQRPIGVAGERAVVGRPIENLLLLAK